MSITDVMPGGMTPATPPRSFGARRLPPSASAPETDESLGQQFAELARRLLKPLALRLLPANAATREAAVHALLHADIRGTFLRLFAYLGVLGLLATGAVQFFRSPPVAATMQSAPRPEWVDVVKPFPAFALSMPELAEAGSSYGIRRHASGGGRRDIMSWGELSGAGPHFMLEVYRPGSEFSHFASAAQEIAVRANDAVAAKSIKPADAIDSKFGSIPLVEFSPGKDSARQCLGFARPFDHPRLQITGWYCSGGPELIERNVIACALDRLTLLAAGSDAKVGELFARAELKRNFCGQRSVLFAATPKHGPGPSQAPETKLRGRLLAR